MKKKMKMVIRFMAVLLAASVLAACSGNEDTNQILEYAEDVDVSVELGPESALTDMDRDDLIFTVKNKGDKTIKELRGEIVFYMPEGEEAGRVGWIFIQANENMEGIAKGEKKAKWRPLAPGDELVLGSDKIIFFAGDDRPLQDKLVPHWEDVEAEVVIKKLAVE